MVEERRMSWFEKSVFGVLGFSVLAVGSYVNFWLRDCPAPSGGIYVYPVNPSFLDKKLLDYIAMDIKSSFDKYHLAAGVNVNLDNIKQSIEIIKNSGINFEFRTTVVPGLVGKEEINSIGKSLKGTKKYTIQNFRPVDTMIDKKLINISPYSKEELQEMKKIAEKYFDEVEVKT